MQLKFGVPRRVFLLDLYFTSIFLHLALLENNVIMYVCALHPWPHRQALCDLHPKREKLIFVTIYVGRPVQ